MSDIVRQLRERAKSQVKKIVFPEARDQRVIEACQYLTKEGIADCLLLGPADMEPAKKKEFAKAFLKSAKAGQIGQEEALKLMDDPLYYAAMMLRSGQAEGLVAGATHTTSSVIRAAIKCFEIDKRMGIVSSCSIMVVPDCIYGEKGTFVFADCGVIPRPSGEQLAKIAISSAEFAKTILGLEPKVAFLSFSTKGSSKNKWTTNVQEAVEIAKAKDSGFLIDGELQADSAIVPEVAERKLKDSKVAGIANVLIFPNLESGNISYKLIQRLARARAIGPVLLGTKQLCSDLSRGCSAEDIIDSTAVTAIRAQERSKE